MGGQCREGGGWILGNLINGTQAEFVRVPFADNSTYRRPASLPLDDAVLLSEVLPTAYEVGVRNGHVGPGDTVIVVGAGRRPLNPEAVVWGEDVLGLPVHDNWWQTETGCIMIANFAACDIRPGSMGRPLPGVEAAVLERGEDGRALITDGRVTEVQSPDVEGELALRPGWPSMFRGYLHDKERYKAAFADGWYLTGDLARRDADGW